VPLKAGEIIDASVMNRKALRAFFAAQIDAAKKDGILFSLHVKTTMMKISDPILFGHCVSVFFADVFEKHGATLTRLGVDPRQRRGPTLLTRIETLPEAEKAAIKADIQATYAKRPGLAMVNSDRGNHHLHVPSDRDRRCVDAGDDPRVRGRCGALTASCTTYSPRSPDRLLLDAVSRPSSRTARRMAPSTRRRWALCRNVGLMAQQAEEYGSHDKTFEVATVERCAWFADDGYGSCCHSRSRPVTSSGCARSRTSPIQGLGQARGAPARALAAPRRCSGSTPNARTTRS